MVNTNEWFFCLQKCQRTCLKFTHTDLSGKRIKHKSSCSESVATDGVFFIFYSRQQCRGVGIKVAEKFIHSFSFHFSWGVELAASWKGQPRLRNSQPHISALLGEFQVFPSQLEIWFLQLVLGLAYTNETCPIHLYQNLTREQQWFFSSERNS